MDVHSRQTTFCVLDENGRKLRSRKVHGRWKEVLKELGQVEKPFEICYEASTGYGHLYDTLSKFARRVQVAHPGALRLIFRSKRKNDRVDAEKLAKLLYLREVPPVHVPKGEVRAWRRTIKYRHRMVGERTRAKNAVRALLRSQGIDAPRGLWTKRGMEWLKRLALTHELDALRRDMLVERIDYLTRGIRRVEKALDKIGRADPRVCLLKTIRGVGMRTAEAVVAWIDRPAPRAHHQAGARVHQTAARPGGLAGGEALAGHPRVLRAHPARRPGPEEDIDSRDGALHAACDARDAADG